MLRDVDNVPHRLLRPRAGPEPGLTPRVDVAVVGRVAAVSPIPRCQSGHYAKGEEGVTHEAEQQAENVPLAAHRYPSLPTPVLPQVPSIVTSTPDLGAWHALDELENCAWQPAVVRQKSLAVPQ